MQIGGFTKRGSRPRSILIHIFVLLVLGAVASIADPKYEPAWDSLDKRPNPDWFDNAKFGIFIHWGVYAVPGWGPKGTYAEWYWNYLMDPKSQTHKFHEQTYGANFKYQDFARDFSCNMFDPDQWAATFARSGAKYVVLTSKHHEGFCLWPNAQSWNWNSVDLGPHRDLCGDLTKAVRAKGLKMGFYYSLYEWYNPDYRTNFPAFVQNHTFPQFKDLINRYSPSIIFSDGEWEHSSEEWRAPELLAWLYNESPCRDDVVVNDRWGKETRGKHGGYYTTEYGEVHVGKGKDVPQVKHSWEENRGIGRSYGYNRNEDVDDYKPAKDLVHLLVDLVCQGGNLLLDVGPTADGRIPVIMQQRLIEIGDWLKVNGEAIYSTRAWRVRSEGGIRYTSKGPTIYAIAQKWPGRALTLDAPKPKGDLKVTMLGHSEPLNTHIDAGKLVIDIPAWSVDDLPCRYAYAFRIEGVE